MSSDSYQTIPRDIGMRSDWREAIIGSILNISNYHELSSLDHDIDTFDCRQYGWLTLYTFIISLSGEMQYAIIRQLMSIYDETADWRDTAGGQNVCYNWFIDYNYNAQSHQSQLRMTIGIILMTWLQRCGTRRPEFEPYIMKYRAAIVAYARSVIKGRWLEAEKFIIGNIYWWSAYEACCGNS